MPEASPPTTNFIVCLSRDTDSTNERGDIERRLRAGVIDRVGYREALIDLAKKEFGQDAKPFSEWLAQPEQQPLAARIESTTPLPTLHEMLLRIRNESGVEWILERISGAPGVESVTPDYKITLED
ncbi:hypothetical protein HY386_02395 [Candidatus Daviesbacteria bacterium]|nr:hypothetical protein [Candidatus Daviesbacteria bacterium]